MSGDERESWDPAITADQFAAAYAERSGMDLTEILTRRVVRPCACDEAGCEGWMMVNPDLFDADLADWKAGHGPHPSRLTADEWEAWANSAPGVGGT